MNSSMAFCIGVPKFYPNRSTRAEFLRHINFTRWWHRVTNLLPASDLVTALVKERESLFAHQMMMAYLKPRLSYYYSRFVTNVGILLPVSILTSTVIGFIMSEILPICH